MSLDIRAFENGSFMVNTIVVASGGECWIVDPGEQCDGPIQYARSAGLAPKAILLTHAHMDHIIGVPIIRAALPGIELICSAMDAPALDDPGLNLSAMLGMAVTVGPADRTLEPGDELVLGDTAWTVLDTSGHGPGGVSYYCQAEGVAIVGDSVFAGGIGRVDFPHSSARRFLRNIRENLLTLPGPTRLLPGHGPETTVETEIMGNPYLAGDGV